MKTKISPLVFFCLAATWLVWGSTYLAIKFALVYDGGAGDELQFRQSRDRHAARDCFRRRDRDELRVVGGRYRSFWRGNVGIGETRMTEFIDLSRTVK